MIKKMKLKDVGIVITGNTPSKKNKEYYNSNDINFFTPIDFEDGRINDFKESVNYISNNAKEKAKILPKGSVLVTCIGIIGKVGITEKESAFNQQINAIIPNKNIINNRYLAYWLISKAEVLRKKANAPVVPIINKTDFQELEIAVPNIETQKEIVKKLNKIQKLIDIKEKQKCLYEDLIKSQFVEMFGTPFVNEKKWKMGTIRDLLTEAKYGTSKPSVEGGKYKYIRMNNITYDGKLDLSDLKFINIPENELEKYTTKKGDILFNRTNSRELVGKTCVYNLEEQMVIAGFVIRVRTNEYTNPYFLSTYLNTKYLKNKLYNMCKNASGQSNINAQELQNIEIYVPPTELQNQFADIVKQIDKQKVEIENSLKEMQELYESLMEKYFG